MDGIDRALQEARDLLAEALPARAYDSFFGDLGDSCGANNSVVLVDGDALVMALQSELFVGSARQFGSSSLHCVWQVERYLEALTSRGVSVCVVFFDDPGRPFRAAAGGEAPPPIPLAAAIAGAVRGMDVAEAVLLRGLVRGHLERLVAQQDKRFSRSLRVRAFDSWFVPGEALATPMYAPAAQADVTADERTDTSFLEFLQAELPSFIVTDWNNPLSFMLAADCMCARGLPAAHDIEAYGSTLRGYCSSPNGTGRSRVDDTGTSLAFADRLRRLLEDATRQLRSDEWHLFSPPAESAQVLSRDFLLEEEELRRWAYLDAPLRACLSVVDANPTQLSLSFAFMASMIAAPSIPMRERRVQLAVCGGKRQSSRESETLRFFRAVQQALVAGDSCDLPIDALEGRFFHLTTRALASLLSKQPQPVAVARAVFAEESAQYRVFLRAIKILDRLPRSSQAVDVEALFCRCTGGSASCGRIVIDATKPNKDKRVSVKPLGGELAVSLFSSFGFSATAETEATRDNDEELNDDVVIVDDDSYDSDDNNAGAVVGGKSEKPSESTHRLLEVDAGTPGDLSFSSEGMGATEFLGHTHWHSARLLADDSRMKNRKRSDREEERARAKALLHQQYVEAMIASGVRSQTVPSPKVSISELEPEIDDENAGGNSKARSKKELTRAEKPTAAIEQTSRAGMLQTLTERADFSPVGKSARYLREHLPPEDDEYKRGQIQKGTRYFEEEGGDTEGGMIASHLKVMYATIRQLSTRTTIWAANELAPFLRTLDDCRIVYGVLMVNKAIQTARDIPGDENNRGKAQAWRWKSWDATRRAGNVLDMLLRDMGSETAHYESSQQRAKKAEGQKSDRPARKENSKPQRTAEKPVRELEIDLSVLSGHCKVGITNKTSGGKTPSSKPKRTSGKRAAESNATFSVASVLEDRVRARDVLNALKLRLLSVLRGVGFGDDAVAHILCDLPPLSKDSNSEDAPQNKASRLFMSRFERLDDVELDAVRPSRLPATKQLTGGLELGFWPEGWQTDLIRHVNDRKSVLVSAPTSAGKTFLAFYLFERILRESADGTCVFVAPTKALVNQVHAEIGARFSAPHVSGVFTADDQVNPWGCRILVTVPATLEIMLLASTEEALSWRRRLRYCVLDEIHYLGQASGGNCDVLEHVLLMLECPFIGLSATLGDPKPLLGWLRRTHKTDVEYVEHKMRAQPLEYYTAAATTEDGFTEVHPLSAVNTNRIDIHGLDAIPMMSPRSAMQLHMALAGEVSRLGLTVESYAKIQAAFIQSKGLFLQSELASLAAVADQGEGSESFESLSAELNFDALNQVLSSVEDAHSTGEPVSVAIDEKDVPWTGLLEYLLVLLDCAKDCSAWIDAAKAAFVACEAKQRLANRAVHLFMLWAAQNVWEFAQLQRLCLATDPEPYLMETRRGAQSDRRYMTASGARDFSDLSYTTLRQSLLGYAQHCGNKLKDFARLLSKGGCENRLLAVFRSFRAPVTDALAVQDRFDQSVERDNIANLLRMLAAKQWLPALLFSLDRLQCDKLVNTATRLVKRGEINIELSDKHRGDCHSAMQRLKELGKDRWSNISAIEFGMAVHHSGCSPEYQKEVEKLFRSGHLRAVFATGTLALGIHMPCRTSVIVGTSVFMTPVTFSQCSGRAGRRGFDPVGRVVFWNVPQPTQATLLSADPPSISGTTGVSPSFVLRVLTWARNMMRRATGEEQGRKFVWAAEKVHQSLARVLRSPLRAASEAQIAHHLRFTVEFLHRQRLLRSNLIPINLAGVVCNLFYIEPSNFLGAHFLAGTTVETWATEAEAAGRSKREVEEQLRVVLIRLLSRVRCGGLARKRGKVLPDAPALFSDAAKTFNRESLTCYSEYLFDFCRAFADDVKDDSLPLSDQSASLPLHDGLCTAFTSELGGLSSPAVCASSFAQLSGQADEYETVDDMLRSANHKIVLDKSRLPVAEFASENLSSVVFDYSLHGDMDKATEENFIVSKHVADDFVNIFLRDLRKLRTQLEVLLLPQELWMFRPTNAQERWQHRQNKKAALAQFLVYNLINQEIETLEYRYYEKWRTAKKKRDFKKSDRLDWGGSD